MSDFNVFDMAIDHACESTWVPSRHLTLTQIPYRLYSLNLNPSDYDFEYQIGENDDFNMTNLYHHSVRIYENLSLKMKLEQWPVTHRLII